MNRKTQYAINGAIGGTLISGLINFFKQLNRLEENPELKFDWFELLKAGGKGALIGGGGGLVVGSIVEYQNSLEKPINTDAFLFSVINTVRLSKNDNNYRSLNDKASKLIELLKIDLGDKLASEPMRLGSTENGTALVNNFDIDICLPFKPGSFASTGEMYSHLNACLERLVGKQSVVETRDQKKSIGVILELYGEKRRIDIVPFKLTPKRGNKFSGYLFVNSPDNPTYTKTDIQALKSFKLTETQKKIVVVLKHWKRKYSLPLSSHLLQNFVVDAYERNYVPKKFTEKVMMVLRHIHNKIDTAVIRSVENTNNVLTDVSSNKKVEIAQACKKAIDDFEYQPNMIIDTFGVD